MPPFIAGWHIASLQLLAQVVKGGCCLPATFPNEFVDLGLIEFWRRKLTPSPPDRKISLLRGWGEKKRELINRFLPSVETFISLDRAIFRSPLPSSFLLTILRQISRRWHFFFLSIWISRFYFTSLFYPLFTNPKPLGTSRLLDEKSEEKRRRELRPVRVSPIIRPSERESRLWWLFHHSKVRFSAR